MLFPLRFLRTANLFWVTLLWLTMTLGAETVSAPGSIVMTGADIRPSLSLDGPWGTVIDPYFSGLYSFHHVIKSNGFFLNQKANPADTRPIEYNFATAPRLTVPGDWNTQRPELMYYEGPVWYEHDFNYQPQSGRRVYLHVGAANYRSWFWVNGKPICEHEGGYTSFNCDATEALHAGANFIVAAVDNTRIADGVPTLETDWWNYGGLTRSLSLIEVPDAFIDQYDLHLAADVDHSTADHPAAEHPIIDGWVHVRGAAVGATVQIQLPELNSRTAAVVDSTGKAVFHIPAPGMVLWSPQAPKLYDVLLRTGQDSLHDLIGFRRIETRGSDILLNGKPIFLQGISIHAEAPYRTGRANTVKDAEALLGWARELGCNFVRLAHYPHDESMLRAADRMGLLVWSENPVYWAIQFDNPKVLAKATQQLDEEIGTSRNHASIILWSMANETPVTPQRTRFIGTLAHHARELDSSRLITAALLVRADGMNKIVDDPLATALDVIGVNEYIGWYEQRPESAEKTDWQIAFQKPLIVSEFGAEARAGNHGTADQRWTEEYQADVYRHQLEMLHRIPTLRGLTPWILMDFRSPNRNLPGVQDGFNRKGLISDQGEKKQAFYVLQKAYSEKSVGKSE